MAAAELGDELATARRGRSNRNFFSVRQLAVLGAKAYLALEALHYGGSHTKPGRGARPGFGMIKLY